MSSEMKIARRLDVGDAHAASRGDRVSARSRGFAHAMILLAHHGATGMARDVARLIPVLVHSSLIAYLPAGVWLAVEPWDTDARSVSHV